MEQDTDMTRHAIQEEDPERETTTQTKGGTGSLLSAIGGVSGMVSLLMVALLGGEIKRQVQVDSHRLDVIESQGSPSLQALTRSLAAEIEARREQDMATNKRVDDNRTEVDQRISHISGLLEKIIDQTTQLISLIKVQQQISRQP